MIVHTNIQQLPHFKNAVITIGTFDGVHTGHRQIIRLMKEEALLVNGETVIITFNPHPRQVVSTDHSSVQLLNTIYEKTALLEKLGIDHLVIAPFTTTFANQDPDKYIANFLVNNFHPHTIIIGYDHRFGRNREGDYKLLEDKGSSYNYTVKEIPVQMLHQVNISSTRIREALLKTDVSIANEFLGYDYFFSGIVTEGNKLGRTIGYPTANLQITDKDKLIPGNGVYAVEVKPGRIVYRDTAPGVQSKNLLLLKGMMNIGVRPTVDGSKRVIEINIFDFNENIYGETLTVTLKKHLREEQKFAGIEALKEQLEKDKKNAIAVLTN